MLRALNYTQWNLPIPSLPFPSLPFASSIPLLALLQFRFGVVALLDGRLRLAQFLAVGAEEMADEKPAAKVGVEAASAAPPAEAQPSSEALKDVPEEEKTAIVPVPEEKPADESLALAVVEKEIEKSSSDDKSSVLAKVLTEKRMSLIDAWEENEKVKAEDKAFKKITSIASWEITKKAEVEAEIRKKQEELERKKFEYAEELKRKLMSIQKEAEEKRANAEAKRGEDIIKAEKKASKYRSTGLSPVIESRFFGLLGA